MTSGIHTVTAGIDGSRPSLDAADWAAREAERRHLTLRLLHAGAEQPAVQQSGTQSSETQPSEAEPSATVPPDTGRSADGTLDRAAIQLAYAHPTLPIVADRTATPAVQALIEAAAEAEELVLGSRCSTGFAGFPLGSVALAVAAGAERPVVVVRAGELPEYERLPAVEGTSPHHAAYLPVVLGLDPDRPADDLLTFAFDAAATRSAPLHVVHTRPSPPLGGHRPAAQPVPHDTAEDEDVTCRALTAALRPWRHRYPETPVSEYVVHGHPGHGLLKASARAGLLVIGRPSTGPGPGGVVRFLLHHVACPVAVVPHGPSRGGRQPAVGARRSWGVG